MMAENVVDEKEFPALSSSATKAKPSVTFQEPNDWEVLDKDTPFEQGVVVVQTNNPKTLRHCCSSPDLRQFSLDVVDEDDEEVADSIGQDDFSMLSGPGSVVSMASGFSFRDAILSPPAKEARNDEPKPSTEQARTRRHQQRIKPKFVVAPIKRCAKSTGDLQSLVIQEEDEILGDTDAMDFYHRKAKGFQGRQNGLKLRPDEAKRKAITMHKKDLQRQGKL